MFTIAAKWQTHVYTVSDCFCQATLSAGKVWRAPLALSELLRQATVDVWDWYQLSNTDSNGVYHSPEEQDDTVRRTRGMEKLKKCLINIHLEIQCFLVEAD